MIIEKKVKQTETVNYSNPKLDLSILRKRGTSKTASGLIMSYMQKARKDNNMDLAIFLQELYKQIKSLEETQKIQLEKWKGKSSFQVIKKPDRFIIITWIKQDQDSEPREVRTEITKEEVNEVLKYINLSPEEKMKSRDIGEQVYNRKWKNIFSDRSVHCKYNLILRLLDHYEYIVYRGGYITKLKQ